VSWVLENGVIITQGDVMQNASKVETFDELFAGDLGYSRGARGEPAVEDEEREVIHPAGVVKDGLCFKFLGKIKGRFVCILDIWIAEFVQRDEAWLGVSGSSQKICDVIRDEGIESLWESRHCVVDQLVYDNFSIKQGQVVLKETLTLMTWASVATMVTKTAKTATIDFIIIIVVIGVRSFRRTKS
jgi:hypothetical protein